VLHRLLDNLVDVWVASAPLWQQHGFVSLDWIEA
jgi:hypothetical protein